MNYLVVYPGRFHLFHLGHLASYEYLAKKYGSDSVYIATSNVQDPETSPFNYADKVAMMTNLGIPASHIVQVKNPYRADEIVGNLSEEEKNSTALIFAVSEKDRNRFKFDPKKNGEPSYMQPLPANIKKLQPLTQHAYIDVTPTVNFQVQGQQVNSASQLRKMYLDGNSADRDQIITDLYGSPSADLRAMFDQRLGANQPQEAVIYGKERRFAGDAPVTVMRESRLQKLQENIQLLRQKLQTRRGQTGPTTVTVETVDVDAVHAESLREHLLSNPDLYESLGDHRVMRRFLDSQATAAPRVGRHYVYTSVQSTPVMRYISVAQFAQSHKLLKLDQQFAYFDVDGAVKRFPETSTLSGDALSQVYFFQSIKESDQFDVVLKLKFPEYKQKFKILDNSTPVETTEIDQDYLDEKRS